MMVCFLVVILFSVGYVLGEPTCTGDYVMSRQFSFVNPSQSYHVIYLHDISLPMESYVKSISFRSPKLDAKNTVDYPLRVYVQIWVEITEGSRERELLWTQELLLPSFLYDKIIKYEVEESIYINKTSFLGWSCPPEAECAVAYDATGQMTTFYSNFVEGEPEVGMKQFFINANNNAWSIQVETNTDESASKLFCPLPGATTTTTSIRPTTTTSTTTTTMKPTTTTTATTVKPSTATELQTTTATTTTTPTTTPTTNITNEQTSPTTTTSLTTKTTEITTTTRKGPSIPPSSTPDTGPGEWTTEAAGSSVYSSFMLIITLLLMLQFM